MNKMTNIVAKNDFENSLIKDDINNELNANNDDKCDIDVNENLPNDCKSEFDLNVNEGDLKSDKGVEDEIFEVILEEEVASVKPRKIQHYDRKFLKALEEAISKLKDVKEFSELDLTELSNEIRRLEEKLHLWREVRQRTIERLREIADYMDSIGKKTGYARVVGSSGGIIAGTLTIAGGVMTVMTAGMAAPVLVAGAGLGLASGLTGGAATLTKKILASKQMKEVDVALEVDAAATCELNVEVERVKEDSRLKKISNVALTVGGLASSTKGLMDLVRGASAGSTVTASLEVIGQIFGEDVNKEITKILLQNGSRVISGAVTSVFGGVTLLWDVYQLKDGVRQLAAGGEEGAVQLRGIADQLEEALGTICYQPDGDEETEDENAQTDNGNENNEIGIDAIEYNDSNENFQNAKH